jgi:hypothetical protein
MVAGSFKKDTDISNHINEYALFHEEIVEKMMARFTVLPMRLLTLFPTEEKVLAFLEDRYNIFKENLGRLFLKAEFGLKVLWPSEKIKKDITNSVACDHKAGVFPAGSNATLFMKKKYERYKTEQIFRSEAEKRIEYIDKFFSSIASEKKILKLQTEKLLLNASYLVHSSRHNEFKRAVERLQKSTTEFNYQFSGPWAPYNFIIMKKENSLLHEPSLF